VRRLDAILRHAEFLSVGTNDLTRLMLGTDREASESQAELSAAHPVILRALHRIARLAAEADRPAAVCGEAAGQPELACLLVGLGYGELSMSPIRSPHVRYRIRNLDRRAAERVAERAVRAETLAEVQRCFRDLRGPYGSGGDSAGEG